MLPHFVGKTLTDLAGSLSSTNAWRQFKLIPRGRDYAGLPEHHLRPEIVDPTWVGATIFIAEHSAELPRAEDNQARFDRNFNARFRVLNRSGRVVGEYTGSIGSQWAYTSAGVRSGVYTWNTWRHKGKYAALAVTTDGEDREDIPMQGVNNNEESNDLGTRYADYINIHASGRRTRSSQGCLNIDRRNDNNEPYLRFMSHFPKGSSGALIIVRHAWWEPIGGALSRWRNAVFRR